MRKFINWLNAEEISNSMGGQFFLSTLRYMGVITLSFTLIFIIVMLIII